MLLGVGTIFAANHISARFAFDHGASVAASVTVRSSATALILLVMMRLQGVAVRLPRDLRPWALLAGVLVATQSYSLYSAVAAIPPALALLVFQTSPMLYVLLTWALRKEAARWNALPPMFVALAGLVLALDLRAEQITARWNEIDTGVLWALASGISIVVVFYLNANALKPLDSRLRTFVMTAVTAIVTGILGGVNGALALPADNTGWLGLVFLTGFYSVGMILLFFMIPRVPATSTAALNFEPIAALALAWFFLGDYVTPLQLTGAFLTAGSIAWLGASKR